MKEILTKSIEEMIRDKRLLERVKQIGIETIEDLCNHSRIELSKMGLENIYINDIIIALQLNGLDLKPNHAKRNHFVLGKENV